MALPKPSTQKFRELFPSADIPERPPSPVSKFITFTSTHYQPEKPLEPPKELAKPKTLPTLPPLIVKFEPEFNELSNSQAEKLISQNNFVGLDPQSVKQVVLHHPIAMLNAISQKISDLLLFFHRAGLAELTYQQRNAMPWLETALEWGITSNEMYHNAHALPSSHPLKNDCLNAAKTMAIWESKHKYLFWIVKDSKALDRLIGQPVLIGSDGWPLSKLDNEGNEFTMEQLYPDTILIYRRISPHISPSLKKVIQKTAIKALKDGRLALIQQK